MDRIDVLEVMTILRAAYPQSFQRMTQQDAEDMALLWESTFQGDAPELVKAAVTAIIVADTREFAPNIALVKEKMRQLSSPPELTEAEAWALVAKAIKNGCYGAKEEFDKLPPLVKRMVGSPSQLRDWSMMESGVVHSVVASHFQRNYRAVAKKEAEWSKLPESVKRLAGGLADRMRLEGCPDREQGKEALQDG